ncbi:MAG: sigma-54-dependent Fis family transcriptional regulator [Gammaproteobacteria bacterium]|nr:sigma-54-dependent Fis family transcriptional regulator [Gammaproteobacteria bacterium]
MQYTGTILVVDDEQVALHNLQHTLLKLGHDVVTAHSGNDALTLLKKSRFDVVLTDLRMEKVDGMQVLQTCRALHPDAEVIMITGYASTDSVVEAMRHGAFYYIAKPFRLEDVRKVVGEAMEKVKLRHENMQLRQQVEAFQDQPRIITHNPQMQQILALSQQIAPTDCNVLITGASGTGKELFARYVHQHSRRRDGPYIAVNCGAFSKELLVNELFGHVKEAFTGALSTKKGLIEAASDGTLFLDEITEMSSEMQVKLLRVLQEKEVLRLGATEPVKTNIRVIAATNRDLNAALAEGQLRQDLYYRLNVVTLRIPPLAQRRDDIPLLVNYFLRKYSHEMGKTVDHISPQAMLRLQQYAFPGNVRELENIVARGTALSGSRCIEVTHLPEELQAQGNTVEDLSPKVLSTLEQHEKAYILWILEQVNGNQSLAAQTLGINRSSLWRKLKSYQQDKSS